MALFPHRPLTRNSGDWVYYVKIRLIYLKIALSRTVTHSTRLENLYFYRGIWVSSRTRAFTPGDTTVSVISEKSDGTLRTSYFSTLTRARPSEVLVLFFLNLRPTKYDESTISAPSTVYISSLPLTISRKLRVVNYNKHRSSIC